MAGCGHRPAPLPTTYPVHGKVTYRDGTPVTGGLVQFQPQAEPSVTTTATIRNDGAYLLITTRDGLRAKGAVSGANRVIVIPTDNGAKEDMKRLPQSRQSVMPTIYPAPYNVEPRDNEFNLVIKLYRR